MFVFSFPLLCSVISLHCFRLIYFDCTKIHVASLPTFCRITSKKTDIFIFRFYFIKKKSKTSCLFLTFENASYLFVFFMI